MHARPLESSLAEPEPLALYIHWPFCVSKCPYCDFNSHVRSHFSRVSFDLIYALPGQSVESWAAELARALSFGTEHLSLYQLTIEPGTRFAVLAAQGEITPVDPDHGAELFELTREMTATSGLPAYETSNHARPGGESRHNLAYWRYRDYAGIGPGAHGRRAGLATVRHRKPENWLNAVTRDNHGIHTEERLDPADRAREALVMGLRLSEGVDLGDIARRCKVDRKSLVNERQAQVLERHGLVRCEADHLSVTPAGMLLLDRILGELVQI